MFGEPSLESEGGERRRADPRRFQLLPAFLGIRGSHEAASCASRDGRVEDADLDVGRERPEALSRSAIGGTPEIAVELAVRYRQQVASHARGQGARRLTTFPA